MCPYCKTEAPANPAGFTWWGGFIGGKVLNHVICTACGRGYNGTTHKPNTTGIIIYTAVVAAVALAVVSLLLR